MTPRRGWGDLEAWVATKISLLTELRTGAPKQSAGGSAGKKDNGGKD
jgi:hypothetical protein